MRQVLGGNTAAVIRHHHLDELGLHLKGHLHGAAFGSELEGVGEQVGDHALDLHAIDFGGTLVRQFGGEAHAGGFGGDLELVNQIIDYFAEVETRFLEYDLTSLRLGE